MFLLKNLACIGLNKFNTIKVNLELYMTVMHQNKQLPAVFTLQTLWPR